MVEQWRRELMHKVNAQRERAIDAERTEHEKRLDMIGKAYMIKGEIVEKIRAAPDDIWGDIAVYIRTEDHTLVHDIVKTLGVRLERKAESDGFNFRGKVEDIAVDVYGMQEVPHCKIETVKRMVEVTEYKTVCNGAEGT